MQILRHDDPRLMEACIEAGKFPILESCAELRQLASKIMQAALVNGCGLAATQLGIPMRLICFNAGLLRGRHHDPQRNRRMANPEIAEVDAKAGEVSMEEGSLSHPGQRRRVLRPKRVKARWMDLKDANLREAWLEGDEARVFLHLMDQLECRWLQPEPNAKVLTEAERETLENLRGGVLSKLQQLNK